MLVYQTYRRINVPSSALCLIYYIGVVLVLACIFPVLMVQPQLSHMKFISSPGGGPSSSGGHYQVSLTSFLVSDEHYVSTDPFSSLELSLDEAHRRCETARQSRCEYWDWMELIESSTQQLHLTTAVQDVVEARRKADETRGETRALSPWRPVSETSDFFFTVEPEHLPLRWTQRISFGGGQNAASRISQDQQNIQGILTSFEVCEQLRAGAPLSSVGSTSSTAQNWLPLHGSGDDRFTLMDLLRVLPNASAHYLTTQQRAGDASGGYDLAESIARHGIELQVTSEFLNTIPRFDDVETSSSSSSISLMDRIAAHLRLNRYQSGPLQYLMCVKAVSTLPPSSSSPLESISVRATTRSSGARIDARDVFSMFTAPADWSRKLPNVTSSMSKDLASKDLRLLRKTFGARIHFSARVNFAVFDTATLLQFIGSTMGFVSLPWLLTETLIGLFGSFRRGGPPHWFPKFLLAFVGSVKVSSVERARSSDLERRVPKEKYS
jgi:hypothetical protein